MSTHTLVCLQCGSSIWGKVMGGSRTIWRNTGERFMTYLLRGHIRIHSLSLRHAYKGEHRYIHARPRPRPRAHTESVTHARSQTCTHTHTHTLRQTHAHMHAHARPHTNTPTHRCTHTHTVPSSHAVSFFPPLMINDEPYLCLLC